MLIKTVFLKRSMIEHACNPSMQKVEAEGSGVQGQPQLLREFETDLGYMRPCLKQTNKQKSQVLPQNVVYTGALSRASTSHTVHLDSCMCVHGFGKQTLSKMLRTRVFKNSRLGLGLGLAQC